MVQSQKLKKLKFIDASKYVTQRLLSAVLVTEQKKLKKLPNPTVPLVARTTVP